MAIDKIKFRFICYECHKQFELLYSSSIVFCNSDIIKVCNKTKCYDCGSSNIGIVQIRYLDKLLGNVIPSYEEMRRYEAQYNDIPYGTFEKSIYPYKDKYTPPIYEEQNKLNSKKIGKFNLAEKIALTICMIVLIFIISYIVVKDFNEEETKTETKQKLTDEELWYGKSLEEQNKEWKNDGNW